MILLLITAFIDYFLVYDETPPAGLNDPAFVDTQGRGNFPFTVNTFLYMTVSLNVVSYL